MERRAMGTGRALALLAASLAPGVARAGGPGQAGAEGGAAVGGPGTRVREVLEARVAAGEAPGIQYVVVSRDGTLFEGAAGIADLGTGRRLEPGTTMMAYSMTKTITAAAVLQLVERGALSLEAPVRSILPDIPYDGRLRVRHLLSQTSGIPNPIPLRWVHLPAEHAAFDERARLAGLLSENRELRFAPGAKVAYSNLSYWLLGRVVEEAGRARFADQVTENVFHRLGLAPEEIGFTIPSPERHARGYLPRWSFMNLFKSFLVDDRFVGESRSRWLEVNDNYVDGAAFGGVVATARALGRFLQDQLGRESRLLGPEARRTFQEQQRNAAGEPVEMTLGWHVGQAGSVPFLFKEGGGAGFHGEMRIYPSAGVGSVVLANNASFDVKAFLGELDREFLR